MTDVERLMAIEEIKQLKARYFRCMDTKDWAGWQAVFTPDAVLDVRQEAPRGANENDYVVTGASKIMPYVRKVIDTAVTVHHGHMPEIEITSDTTARGTWSMEDLLRWPEGSGQKPVRGYGHYHETYEKLGGRWLIKTLKLTRLRVDRG